MTAPNRSTLWGRILVEELAAGGLESVCIAPGSRSTPLTVAFADHPDVTVFSHLDERSAGYFALGRARRTGRPTAVVCTSGTATANLHPAVIEASHGRVPLLVLTADRPPELRDSGANQTIDQDDLYGDTVRWAVTLPEPRPADRTVRMLRTTAARALAKTTGTPAGPVHCNCPFSKPLEPVAVPGDIPEDFEETLAGHGRDGPFVETTQGRPTIAERDVESVASAIASSCRPLLVAGPADPAMDVGSVLSELGSSIGAPILADPLSGARFGSFGSKSLVCGGYDAYLDDEWPAPDLVLRTGSSPTSKRLRRYLQESDARQFLIDPAESWREATFTATDLVGAAPEPFFESLVARIDDRSGESSDSNWIDRFLEGERRHWTDTDEARTEAALESDPFEGAILSSVVEHAPDPATIFVSNSMPVRDLDRFARPRSAELSVLANRGASGIDGIVSTALGAGSATTDPLVLVTGDLAFYHDMNGLLAIDRCGVDATIVLIDNDGGGIFHKLPIEAFDPPFTAQFKTPHGISFDAVGDLYDLDFRPASPAEFTAVYRNALETAGTQVISVSIDAETSHRRRDELETQSRW